MTTHHDQIAFSEAQLSAIRAVYDLAQSLNKSPMARLMLGASGYSQVQADVGLQSEQEKAAVDGVLSFTNPSLKLKLNIRDNRAAEAGREDANIASAALATLLAAALEKAGLKPVKVEIGFAPAKGQSPNGQWTDFCPTIRLYLDTAALAQTHAQDLEGLHAKFTEAENVIPAELLAFGVRQHGAGAAGPMRGG